MSATCWSRSLCPLPRPRHCLVRPHKLP
jgi:hypothetical protein